MDLPSVKHFFAFLQNFSVQSFSTFSLFAVENRPAHNILGVKSTARHKMVQRMKAAPAAHTGYII